MRFERPLTSVYIHFKTKELEKMQSQGDFWHMILLGSGLIVAQDEVEIYTLHKILPPGVEVDISNPAEFIKETLGGMVGPLDIKIDEVILNGKWRSDLSIANSFRSDNGRIFLAGDSGTCSHSNFKNKFSNQLRIDSPSTHPCWWPWPEFRNPRCL